MGVSSPPRDLRFDMRQVRQLLGLPEPGAANWREHAACIGLDVDDFYATVGASVEPARRICNGCPVRRACLDEAINRGEPHGLWGGMTPGQRHREAKRRGIAVPVESDSDVDEVAA